MKEVTQKSQTIPKNTVYFEGSYFPKDVSFGNSNLSIPRFPVPFDSDFWPPELESQSIHDSDSFTDSFIWFSIVIDSSMEWIPESES